MNNSPPAIYTWKPVWATPVADRKRCTTTLCVCWGGGGGGAGRSETQPVMFRFFGPEWHNAHFEIFSCDNAGLCSCFVLLFFFFFFFFFFLEVVH